MLKFKITERGSREFYEEYYYVAANYSKIKNNPGKKVSSILKNNIVYFISTGLFVIIMFMYFVFEKDYVCFTIGTVLLFALLLFIRMDQSIRRAINALMNYEGTKEITISKSKVTYKDKNKEIGFAMDQVSWVVINKYSICFIPSQRNGALVAMPIEYKKDIVDFLKEEKLDDLLVDNSDKY